MAKSNEEIFRDFNEAVNNSILTNPDFIAAEASGATRASLINPSNVTISSTKFVKLVTGYYEAIDKGRGKNVSNSGGLVSAIYEWLQFKKYGFNYSNDKERLGKAIAISRKMAKEGSFKHRNVSFRTDIFEKAIRDNLPELLRELAINRVAEIRGQIRKTYRV